MTQVKRQKFALFANLWRDLLPRVRFCILLAVLISLQIGRANVLYAEPDALLHAPPWQYYPHHTHPNYPTLSPFAARAYLLVDMRTGYILASKNEYTPRVMASLTKMMTAYIIMTDIKQGRLKLDEKYTLHNLDLFRSLPQDASRMGLQVGDKPSIDELLQGLIIGSGNDAAIMLAIISRGSLAAFVVEMNKMAAKLGLYNTEFADSSGLSAGNIGTAYDLSLLAYYLIEFSEVDYESYSRTKKFTWNDYTRESTNLLLKRYDGLDGLKTGYTEEADFNLVASAVRDTKEGLDRRMLSIVLGVPAQNIAEGKEARADIAEELLNYGFGDFTVLKIGYPQQQLKVWGGKKKSTMLTSDVHEILLPTVWQKELTTEIDKPKFAWAPIVKGDALARVIVSYTAKEESASLGENIAQDSSVPLAIAVPNADKKLEIVRLTLRASEDISKSNIFMRIIDYIKMLFYKITI